MAMARAGVPTRVITAYSSFMQSATYFNGLALGTGEGAKRPCAIPQGCPFSMLGAALLGTAWVRSLQALQSST
eukprot:1385114-Alexandrium_andersonii.AAC.1